MASFVVGSSGKEGSLFGCSCSCSCSFGTCGCDGDGDDDDNTGRERAVASCHLAILQPEAVAVS